MTGVYVQLVYTPGGLVAQLADDAHSPSLLEARVDFGGREHRRSPHAPRTFPHRPQVLPRRDFNPATALVDAKTSLRRGCGTTTGGLIDAGFSAVSACCTCSAPTDKAEAISWAMCRLVASRAAIARLDGKKNGLAKTNPYTDLDRGPTR